MKNIFFALAFMLIGSFAFASNNVKTINQSNLSLETTNIVANSGACATTVGGQIFITSVSCFLCSDERTEAKCKRKLKELVESFFDAKVSFNK